MTDASIEGGELRNVGAIDGVPHLSLRVGNMNACRVRVFSEEVVEEIEPLSQHSRGIEERPVETLDSEIALFNALYASSCCVLIWTEKGQNGGDGEREVGSPVEESYQLHHVGRVLYIMLPLLQLAPYKLGYLRIGDVSLSYGEETAGSIDTNHPYSSVSLHFRLIRTSRCPYRSHLPSQ